MLTPRLQALTPFALVLALGLGSVGCSRKAAAPPPGFALQRVPEALETRYTKLVNEGERNWVLNLNEIAVQAMAMREPDIAARALSESMLNINNVFGSTPEAEKARMIFFSEDVKLFKGDPYERAMTFLYRGILYMQEGDYENARACFRQGALQDAFAEEDQNRADWVVFDYLIARCEVELGRLGFADEAWKRADESFAGFEKKYRESVGGNLPIVDQLPQVDLDDNLLVICVQGRGPRKERDGRRGQFITYKRPMNQPGPQELAIGDKMVQSWIIDSVFFQARTRGGRPFDRVQKRKVVFKDVTSKTGDAGMIGGVVILSQADSEAEVIVGLVVLGGGLLVKLFSELIRTGADIRAWQSLPDTVSIYSGSHAGDTVTIKQYGGTAPLAETVPLAPVGKGLTVVFSATGDARTLLIPKAPTPRRMP